MTISKAQWNTEGDSVRLSMPFSKVDQERRIVSGFATLDNVDKQADIVTTEASLKAFAKFRGNIREMHQPISVGKMVSFKEDKYFDPETKKFYTGVYVSAYVSKGAQDTWEKVLDGTLSGFSIGGRMNKYDDMYDEKMEKTIRVIKEYDLTELSLVDNPANQFANIMSIEKVDGVEVVKGLDTEIENVFWDDENGVVTVSKDDSAVSPISGTPMKNIGFVETNDVEKTEMIKFLVDSAKGINLSKMNKEEDPMTETTEDVVANADDVVVEDAQVAPEADAAVEDVVKADEAEATKAEDMDEDDTNGDSDPEEEMDKSTDMEDKSYDEKKSETVDEVAEVSKADDVLANAIAEIQTGITSAFSDLSAVVKSLNDEIADLKKSLGVVTADVASVKNDVTTTKGELNEFGKGLDAVVADTAFRKSGDLGEIVQETQIEKSENSLWGGRFLKTADLFR
jgi:hypothetical protein